MTSLQYKYLLSSVIGFFVGTVANAQFTAIKLPALSGNNNANGTVARAINNAGVVTGESATFNNFGRFAFRWKQGSSMTNLGTAGVENVYSIGNAINESGFIAGDSGIDGIVWSPQNTPTKVTVPPGGSGTVRLNGINSQGNLAGYFLPGNGSYRASIWINGIPTAIGTLGGRDSFANAINDLNQVAVTTQLTNGRTVAALFSPQTGLVALPSLGNSTDEAIAINQNGFVAGYSTNHQGQRRAVVWEPNGNILDLGQGRANSINIFGQVVGEDNSGRAFLWDPRFGYRNLNSLVPSIPDQLSFASGINDLGQIVATTTVITQQQRFSYQINSLNPIPEPGTIFALSIGTAFLCRRKECLMKRKSQNIA